jgi:hypothetical protein
MYGCAVCGSRVTLPPADAFPVHLVYKLRDLVVLQVPADDISSFNQTHTLSYRSLVRVDRDQDTPVWYYLHQEYLRTTGSPTLQSEALLCEKCAQVIGEGRERHARSRQKPYFSVARGFDYSKAVRLALPELTQLEKCCIRLVMPYMTVVKLRAGGNYAMSGNAVAIPTPSAELSVDALNRMIELPRRDVGQYYTLMLIGPLDKMKRMMGLDPTDPRALNNVYRKLLHGMSLHSRRLFPLPFYSIV